MLLNELGTQYLKQSEICRGRISELRPVLKRLTGDEEKQMRTRLKGLYAIVRDSRLTGLYLQSYYKEGANRWPI